MVAIPSIPAGGAAIPVIGYGTWRLSGDVVQQGVEAALACGYRHVDTAAMYENEVAVGAGLKASGVPRDDIFLTTKVRREEISRDALLRSAEASLKRLGVGQVDLLLLHWPNDAIPLAESIAALNEAKARGLTRHIGVSNFPAALLAEAIGLSAAPIVANQCEYHPRLAQNRLIAACKAAGVAFVSYCPLGRGDLMGDPEVARIAGEVGRSPAEVVLRWHVQQGIVAIPRSSSPEHIAENFRVFDFSLAEPQMAALSDLARPDGRIVRPATAPRWDVG